MNQIILKEIKPSLLSKLTYLATLHSRTLEQEITAILEQIIDNKVIITPENKGWQKGFFEEVIGAWKDEPLIREAQPEEQDRDFLL
ncbi:hypothetical protein ACN4EE_12685 [Geminocystis sp. CENA526]|uniref:hypothetical protein n=1 Tax=Geminocystis sp. CENA526 TaxID=1355871 RepID=UPI003D6DCFD4